MVQCASMVYSHVRIYILLHLTAALSAQMVPSGGAQEQVTQIRMSAANEASLATVKLLQAVSERAGRPTSYAVRRMPTSTQAISDLMSSGTGDALTDLASGSRPLTPGEYSSFTRGVMHVPFAFHTVSFFVNLPENTSPTTSPLTYALNITACTAAGIFSGAINVWNTPEFKDATLNPGLVLTINKAPPIVILVQPSDSADTTVVEAFFAAACPTVWTAGVRFPSGAVTTSNTTWDLMRTPYSIGYARTSEGAKNGLNELQIQNAAGAYQLAASVNITNTVAALSSQFPASYSSSFAAVQSLNMGGTNVHPLTVVDYLYIPLDMSTSGERGPLIQAMVKYTGTVDGQNILSGLGVTAFGAASTVAALVSTAAATMILGGGTTQYSLEQQGLVEATGSNVDGLSGNRFTQTEQALADLTSTVNSIQLQMTTRLPIVLQGSGSSAMALVMWKLMDQFSAMSSSPLWMGYRGTGSGTGAKEIVGNGPPYVPLTTFGISDVPMSTASWSALKNANIQIVHIPLAVSAMNWFIHTGVTRLKVQLTSCILAKIYTGVTTTWDDAEITSVNGGTPVVLTPTPIRFLFRSGSSGTTAVITEFLTRSCPDFWTFPSANLIPQWFNISNGVGQATTASLASALASNAWYLGYMESGVGQALGSNVTEVSLRNKAGKFLTSAQANVPAAASAVLNSPGWPSTPIENFSGVTILDQPGDATWPIVSLPFMFVRVDNTASGEAGMLLIAFLQFLLQASTQANLVSLGLSPLPEDVRLYTLNLAVPLLLPDTRLSRWYAESVPTAYTGAGSRVITDPSVKTNYYNYEIQALQDGVASARGLALAPPALAGVNFTQILINFNATIQQLNSRLDTQDYHTKTLQSVAIAGIAFGVAGVCLAIFASCRVFVISSVSPGNTNGGSMSQSGSVRRARSASGDDDLLITKCEPVAKGPSMGLSV